MSGWLELVVRGVLTVLGLSMLLSLYRVVRGPSLADRVVALDLVSLQSAGLIVAYAVQAGDPLLLDVALVLLTISSLGTIVIARYLYSGQEGRG